MVLEIAQDVNEWPLKASLGEQRWIHAAGIFALSGDAYYAMFPYLFESLVVSSHISSCQLVGSAQGAAQAVEDGAVLGTLFRSLQHRADIPDTLLGCRPGAKTADDQGDGWV